MKTKIVYVLVSDDSDYYYEQVMLSIRSLIYYNLKARIEVLVDEDTFASLRGNREAIKQYADVIEVDTPSGYDKMRRSRYLKTNMRNLVAGDFLFLDCDTVICESIEEIDKLDVDLGMVADLNGPLLLDDQNTISKGIKAGFPDFTGKPYFNSGVIFVKDTDMTRSFFNSWYENYLKSESHGVFNDQPALCQTNAEFGYIVSEIPGIWNCQFKMKGYSLLNDANIMHYYSNNGNNKLPWPQEVLFNRIKEKGDFDLEILKLLSHPRTILYTILSISSDSAFNYLISESLYTFFSSPRLYGLSRRVTSLLLFIKNSSILGEVIRFGIVGTIATGIHYGLYYLLQFWINVNVAFTLGYITSFICNFFLSSYITFRKKATLNRGLGFGGAHLLNYLLQIGLLNFFIWIGVSRIWAPLPVYAIAIPVNFLMVRYVFKHNIRDE